MIRAIAFDLDHTLYDRAATFTAMAPDFFAHFFPYLSSGLSLDALSAALRQTDTATCNKSDWPGMYALLKEQNILFDDPGFDYYMDYMFAHFPSFIVPYEDSYATLAYCKRIGLKTGLLTNGKLEFQEKKIAAMQLREKMDFCMVSCVSGESKPSAVPFQYLADKLGVLPGETIFVGDNPKNDVEGARRAGMHPIWFDVLHDWDIDLASAPTIHALSDLRGLLPEMRKTL